MRFCLNLNLADNPRCIAPGFSSGSACVAHSPMPLEFFLRYNVFISTPSLRRLPTYNAQRGVHTGAINRGSSGLGFSRRGERDQLARSFSCKHGLA